MPKERVRRTDLWRWYRTVPPDVSASSMAAENKQIHLVRNPDIRDERTRINGGTDHPPIEGRIVRPSRETNQCAVDLLFTIDEGLDGEL